MQAILCPLGLSLVMWDTICTLKLRERDDGTTTGSVTRHLSSFNFYLKTVYVQNVPQLMLNAVCIFLLLSSPLTLITSSVTLFKPFLLYIFSLLYSFSTTYIILSYLWYSMQYLMTFLLFQACKVLLSKNILPRPLQDMFYVLFSIRLLCPPEDQNTCQCHKIQ